MSELALRLIAENKAKHARGEDARVLDLGNCGLTEVPEEVGELVWLEELILSASWNEDNFQYEIDENSIPENYWIFGHSQNEQGSNIISALPKKMGQLKFLKKLIISDSSISDLSPISGLINLEILDFSVSKVNDLSILSGLINLTQLKCAGNPFSSLSPLSNLKKLQSLDCSGSLSSVNNLEDITNITSLRRLYCRIDKLVDIRPLSKLYNLESIDFENTQVYDLRPLQGLINLQLLKFSNCQISNLSPLRGLTNLRHIVFDRNSISSLSPLENLPRLKYVICRKTNITDLSPIIPSIKRGLRIIAEDCPLIFPPPEVVKQGNAAILEYFRQKEKTGEAPLLEAKLILLGDGRSGKTSLANRLLGKPMPSEADRTQGVDIVIGEYNFEVAQQRQFKLNIWDFAGQDKYKPLHQFFYTESSLYVMVADSGNTRTDFDDWLQTAELFGEGSPLVLVLNEFRDGIGFGTFDREIWQKRFPNLLKEVFVVNLDTQRGFDVLEHQLRLLAQSLPHTRYPYPNNWAAIRRELEARRDENFISFQEYLRICRNNQLPEKESALVLAQVLHKIGVCLHYQKSDLLKQVVILKNEWATEAVYKILDDAKVAEENKGFFDREDLERIWSDDAYADMRPQLLELMQQFKMAYPLPGAQGFVAPPLLPPAPPSDWTWPVGDDLELYIEYEFLPKALMTQFIVSRHPDIDQGKTLVWRNGVVLRWPGDALAEVLKTKLQGKDAFYIRSQGRDRKGMMTVILKTFRDLHEEYKGIKLEEKVPCPCAGCTTGKNKQHYFEYRKLKNWLEKGVRMRDCDESLEELDLLQLLENHFVFEKMEAGQPLILKKDLETPLFNSTLDQATGLISSAILQKQPNMTTIKKVFISHSSEDKTYLSTLKKQLAPLLNQGIISTWDYSNLVAGETKELTINRELNSADLIILLVSADYMADAKLDAEMKAALDREKRGEASVIPIIVRSCLWKSAPFAHLTILPDNGKPIATWNNADTAWEQVVGKIEEALLPKTAVPVTGSIVTPTTPTVPVPNPAPSPSGLKTIKIFLASSSELLQDRDQFEIFINRENKNLIKKGVFLELVRWEDFLDAMSPTRLQDEYNLVLRTCDIAVCLFYTKVGKYTAEEFDTALGEFLKAGKPKIFTYFKDAPVKPSEIRAFNTVLEFKDKLEKLGHFPNHYESMGDLKHHFGEQLEKLGIVN